MKLSTERILTTHVGSLPRPKAMLDLIRAREAGEPVDEAAFEAQAAQSVVDIVAQQVAAGIDIVSDGEQSKPSYATYVKHRVAGIDMDPSVVERGRDAMVSLDRLDHPDYVTATNFSGAAFPRLPRPAVVRRPRAARPLRPRAHFRAAVDKGATPTEAFI